MATLPKSTNLTNTILNKKNKRLRSLGWVVVFFLVLALLLFPLILVSKKYNFTVSIGQQAVVVIATSMICLLLRKEPLTNLVGSFNLQWFKNLSFGLFTGAALMLLPALILFSFRAVTFEFSQTTFNAIGSVSLVLLEAAVVEELIFRGFIFRRLITGIGFWPAQIVLGLYFLLTHLNNPGMTGHIKILAGINIFLASLLFGLAWLRTKSLAMPIGIHFMANWVQGVLLGFGVSGFRQESVFKPVFGSYPDWLTGGNFGLEASLPGLVCVVITVILLYKWKHGMPEKYP